MVIEWTDVMVSDYKNKYILNVKIHVELNISVTNKLQPLAQS